VCAAFLVSCGGESVPPSQTESFSQAVSLPAAVPAADFAQAEPGLEVLNRSLDELAEFERSGVYMQGLALAESSLRERAGDFAGAVAAAYKELALAYGQGSIPQESLEQGLLNVLALQDGGDATVRAAEGILAFERGQWDKAEGILGSLFNVDEEPDGFARWMLLVCALEQNRDQKQAAAAYRAIRARYAQFPGYWYRGARVFSGAIAAEHAERCISLAPAGPFAGECRNILAAFTGLQGEDGSSLRTKTEIENIISRSVSQGNPEILDALIPLISLPDNPYTVYAVGALRALASVPKYRDFFSSQAAVSKGRLAERLAYICRG
jgi:hypothetical protein